MSVEITDDMVENAAQASWDAVPRDWKNEYGLWEPMPTWANAGDTDHIPARERAHAALEAAAPAIQEAVAYRIASKLRTLQTERAQADDINAARNFKQAADVAVRVAKGGW